MCNGKEYSGRCASNVTAAVNGTKGTDYDKVLYCRASGNAECSPSKAVGPIISSSGEYTYCAAYEKNGKQGATSCTHKNIIIAPDLSCSMSLDSNDTNKPATISATISGGSGTLTAKGDGTYEEVVANTKFSKKVSSGGKYTFTVKDTSNQQADCSITLTEQYQIVQISEVMNGGMQEDPSCVDSSSGTKIIRCTTRYYVSYSEGGKIYRYPNSGAYYYADSISGVMQSCSMKHPGCTNTKVLIKETGTRTTTYGNWVTWRQNCDYTLYKRCYHQYRFVLAN